MIKRILMVFITLIFAIVTVLIAAKNPTGPNTISYDEPIILWITIGMVVLLFIPPLILAFFSNKVVGIISSVYLSFVVISFLGMIPIGILFSNQIGISAIGALGALISLGSIIVTLKTSTNN